MLNWIKKLQEIVSNYDADLKNAHARIAALETVIRDRTNIAVDVGFRNAHHVIVIGRYKGTDYIQSFEMDSPSFGGLVDQLKDYSRYGAVKRMDSPPVFKAVFERDGYNF